MTDFSPLPLQAREHCLGLLEEALSSNCQAAGATQGPDLQAKAVELEHEMFRNAKAANLYKASVLRKVAEIHRTSKDGQLYHPAGGAKSCSAQAEPTEHDILPASQVYSLKPKRVGAGFPKGSLPFQTASQLMEEMRAGGQAPRPEQEPTSQPRGLQDEESSEPVPGLREAPGSSAHCGGPSPEKAKGPSGGSPAAKARANKKQQLLAAAALKDSQNIARFFCQRAESPPALASAPGAEGGSPSCAGVRGPLAVAPETCTGEEDGALGRLAARPQTECTREGPSACPLRDPGPPEGQLTPPEGTLRGKRPRPQQENPESQARKRPHPSAGASVLAEANDNILASGQSTISRTAQGSCQLPATGTSLKVAANIVVKCLTPFYKEGKFASKDLFKAFARHLSHALAQDPSPGRSVKEEAQHLIRQFFRGRARCESEADWHGLCDPQR